MCFYIGIEDLAANALIEILSAKKGAESEQLYVTLAELEKYGAQVVRHLNEKGDDALLILSGESTSMMFRNYSDFFEEIETSEGTAISLREGKTVTDLVVKLERIWR